MFKSFVWIQRWLQSQQLGRQPGQLQPMCAAICGLVASAWSYTAAAGELNMPRGVTDVSNEIYNLHMIIFYVCVVIGILVFGTMIVSIIRHRKSVHPEPATFTHSTVAEVAWTTVPILILIAMAYPAAKLLIKLEDNRNADVTVEVTGYQWNWHYKYPQHGVEFFSKLADESMIARHRNSGVDISAMPTYLLDVDRPMVVPVSKKVVLKLTANDVIHAWWVPELGGKKDAIPGFVNTMWFQANEVGTYRGQCSELCGRDHGFMPIVVEVVSEEQYEQWLESNGGQMNLADSRGTAANVANIATVVATPETSLETQVATSPPMQLQRVDSDIVDVADDAVSDVAVVVETAMDLSDTVSQPVETDDTGAIQSNVDLASEDLASEDLASEDLTSEDLTRDELMALGEKTYQQHCVACHQVDGAGLPPAFPAITGGAIVTGPIDKHITNIVKGVAGTAMISFASQLSDEEIAAVVTYQRNALGNSVGDEATPADVAAIRSN